MAQMRQWRESMERQNPVQAQLCPYSSSCHSSFCLAWPSISWNCWNMRCCCLTLMQIWKATKTGTFLPQLCQQWQICMHSTSSGLYNGRRLWCVAVNQACSYHWYHVAMWSAKCPHDWCHTMQCKCKCMSIDCLHTYMAVAHANVLLATHPQHCITSCNDQRPTTTLWIVNRELWIDESTMNSFLSFLVFLKFWNLHYGTL